MTVPNNLLEMYGQFLCTYDAKVKDDIWSKLSGKFHKFWNDRLLSNGGKPLSDDECDEIIKLLDRNGKGNNKESEAIARAMIPQGAWRRLFNEFRSNKKLSNLIWQILTEEDLIKKAEKIDELYRVNEGHKNNLTGPSGNTMGAFLAAFEPSKNLSIISLNDKRLIIDFLNIELPFIWENASIGTRIVETNIPIINALNNFGITGSARTISSFLYSGMVKPLWRGKLSVKRADKEINVTVPVTPEDVDDEAVETDTVRESMQIQGLIAKIGTIMGFAIWLPKADRSRVFKVWKPAPGELLEELPLGYDSTTTKTIEQIDVLWLRKRSIVRAFEVEHTTSIYSGLLRMADLVALQPNINIKLHIVAPIEKREKVLQEIRRPVFSLLEGRALAEMCTYLSYENIKDISDLKHLNRLDDAVIEDYEEKADE